MATLTGTRMFLLAAVGAVALVHGRPDATAHTYEWVSGWNRVPLQGVDVRVRLGTTVGRVYPTGYDAKLIHMGLHEVGISETLGHPVTHLAGMPEYPDYHDASAFYDASYAPLVPALPEGYRKLRWSVMVDFGDGAGFHPTAWGALAHVITGDTLVRKGSPRPMNPLYLEGVVAGLPVGIPHHIGEAGNHSITARNNPLRATAPSEIFESGGELLRFFTVAATQVAEANLFPEFDTIVGTRTGRIASFRWMPADTAGIDPAAIVAHGSTINGRPGMVLVRTQDDRREPSASVLPFKRAQLIGADPPFPRRPGRR